MQLYSIVRDLKVLDLIRWAEIIDIQWSNYLPLVHLVRQIAPATPVVVTEHDIYAEAIRRDLPDDAAGNWLRRMVQAKATLMAEVRDLNRCDLVYVFNPSDLNLLAKAGLRTPIRVAEPYMDVPVGVHPAASVPGRVIFVGAFTRRTNRHAAVWLQRDVWPAIQTRFPEASLLLVGNGSESLTGTADASGTERVSTTGYVKDLAAFYDTATLAVAPLFTGAGLKFKVSQAMAYGLPVVATSIAAEGFIERGAPVLIADTAGEFVDHISSLLAEPDKAHELGKLSRKWVGELFNFTRFVGGTERELAALIRSARR